MIEVATIKEAQAIKVSEDGRPVVIVVAGSPCRIYFEGDDDIPDTGADLEARAALIDALNAEWTRRKDAGFTFMEKTIDSDPVSRENIANAAVTALICLSTGQEFSLAPAPGWKCADNTYLPLDAECMLAMQAAMVQAGVALFAHAQELKAQIANDPSIDVTSGWPQT